MSTESSDRRNPALRVLVVEDEAIIATDIVITLEQLGFDVAGPAGTADEAVALALSSKPDLILMDIRLKGKKTGIDAAREIRHKLESPVIFLTSHNDKETLAAAYEAAPDGYLVKPFQEEKLAAAIEFALGKHRERTPPPKP